MPTLAPKLASNSSQQHFHQAAQIVLQSSKAISHGELFGVHVEPPNERPRQLVCPDGIFRHGPQHDADSGSSKQEASFGPFIGIQTVSSDEEAVQLTNDTLRPDCRRLHATRSPRQNCAGPGQRRQRFPELLRPREPTPAVEPRLCFKRRSDTVNLRYSDAYAGQGRAFDKHWLTARLSRSARAQIESEDANTSLHR